MKTILIIEDESSVANVVKSAIEDGINGAACIIELDFSKSSSQIAIIRPDAIVLDLMEGRQSANLPGQQTWKFVWEKIFCPIIIYTGSDDDLQPPVPASHPFVKRIPKGSGSPAKVVEALKEFAPAIQAVRALREEIDAVIHRVLRDTAGEGHVPMNDPVHLLHAGRRRIAATMDDPTITSNREMASWEQYLIPAIGESPLTADLLRKRNAKWDDPTAYRLVLTPSCDLVKGRCEPTLIAACCEETARLAKKLSLSLTDGKLEKDCDKIVSKALTAGSYIGFLPLPSFPARLPIMVANLKNLDVLNYDSVGPADSNTHDFLRIASIDSPFREQVAWAFLTTVARPGMPDRDLQSWAKEILKANSSTVSAPSNQAKVG
jgi:hypothetical protein